MATIDLDISGLKQSTNPRGSSPNGNIYFDLATGEIQLIDSSELATIAGIGANPLAPSGGSNGGITMRALYAFERQERKVDENLRKYDYFIKGSFKFAGAYEFVNGRKLAAVDRKKIRNSGWIERAANGGINRIYFGVRSLNPIEATSQPYYQLAAGGAPTNFQYQGPINEGIQVFGSTANGDATAGNFDSRTYLAVSVRTFGFSYDRKILADSGITQMDGYASGFALGESTHLTSGSYDLADVYGAGKVTPWTGMSLQFYGSNQSRSGFTDGSANFNYVLANSAGGSIEQVVAFLDALAQTDDDIDAGAGTINGKRVSTWYSYDAQGRIVTRQGLHIDGLPESDKQKIVQTDIAGLGHTYPFNVDVRVKIGNYAFADANAWFHCYIKDGVGATDFNSSTAVTLNDASGNPVKGLVSGYAGANVPNKEIRFSFAYDSNTQAGRVVTEDLTVVFECEGNGTATEAKTEFLISRSAIVTATCEPGQETNL